MFQGLPTFRAGGIASCFDCPEGGERGAHKTALTPTYFSKDHFSSPFASAADPTLKRTRVSVKVLEGKDLLVSDLLTGTSDPVALLWVGACDEGDADLGNAQRVQSTEVRKHTIDPVWDAEFIFPLDVQCVEDVVGGKVNVLVRDHDDADGDVHYVDLGQAFISLEKVLMAGNVMAHTQLVQLPARWYPLQRCRGIKKARGAVKIAIGIFFGPESVLLGGVASNECIDHDQNNTATRFEDLIQRIRGDTGMHARDRTVSMSPTRHGATATRSLTARGGTISRRPKSAPEAVTLHSPTRVGQRPFELKPVQAPFPSSDVHTSATLSPDADGRAVTSGARAGTGTFIRETQPRWRNPYGSPERESAKTEQVFPVQSERTDSPSHLKRSEARQNEHQHQHQHKLPAVWKIDSPPMMAQQIRRSSKLSRLARRATHASNRDETEGSTLRAHRWHRALLESMQRLENRSTEGIAYGELRAMVREASPSQVGKVVAATHGVGAGCSLAARRYALRLLAWLCWEQPRAASKVCSSIVSYVLDRVRDDETASLRSEMAVCVGAVMLSALRKNNAAASMVQTRRFLKLVREQRTEVRESAGACCVAAVLPPPPRVSVEVETGLRRMEDVCLSIGQAAQRAGRTNVVPKEAVLLPGGRAVIELMDAEAAAEFFYGLSVASHELPRSWIVCAFPEEFCAQVKLGQAAHYAKLCLNSEEVLASLLEALDDARSKGTHAQLLVAIAAMARGCAATRTNEFEGSGEGPVAASALEDLSATLRKGLPAIIRIVSTILECPVRRAYTWTERTSALDVIIALALLNTLRGPGGPLGDNRARLSKGVTSAKHDSVEVVRKKAGEALVALKMSDAEERQGNRDHMVLSTRFESSIGGVRISARGAEITLAGQGKHGRTHQKEQPLKAIEKKKTLDGVIKKAENASLTTGAGITTAAAEIQRNTRLKRGPDSVRDLPQADKGDAHGDTKRSHVVDSASTLSPASQGSPSPPSEDRATQSSPVVVRRGSSEQHGVTNGFSTDMANEHTPAGAINSPPLPLAGAERPTLQNERTEGVSADDVDRGPAEGHDVKGTAQKENTTASSTVDSADAKIGEYIQPHRPPEAVEVRNASVQAVTALSDRPPTRNSPPQYSPPASNAHWSECPPETSMTRCTGDILGRVEGSARSVVPSPLPPPKSEGAPVDTICLLRCLSDKTDSIASALNSLDQRLLGMERTLEERPHTATSPSASPSRKVKKRPRPTPSAFTDKSNLPKEGKHAPKVRHPDTFSRGHTGDGGITKPSRGAAQIRRDIGLLIQNRDIEGAFRLGLRSGTERDVLRLMSDVGGPDLCRRRLGMETRDRLYAFFAKIISSGQYVEHALPWVFELVRAGEARALPLAIRMQLAGALHGLAANPTDQGIMAARLGPYLSLTSVGRSSLSDTAEGGGVFSSMHVAGGDDE